MSYRELAAGKELHPLVACRWVRRVPEAAARDSSLVLPDGCVDLLWRDGRLLLAGLDSAAWRSPVRPGQRILGLRLRPGVAGAVLGIPASEVLDERLPLSEVLGPAAGEIEERLGDADAEDAEFGLIEGLVASRIPDEGPDPLVLAASRRLGFPGSRVDWLADALGISERQLRRRFHAAVGYGPKTLDRVLRFSRLVTHAPEIAGGEDDLARVAADLGYADQAHMTRDCVELSGLPPGRLAELWAT
jgi:AraC-like DNA-binding protein